MTIASLIVDVAANTAKLTKDVEEVHGKLDRITAVAGTVGKALAAAFTVTAIANVAKQTLDYAGTLTDLAAKTGISTTGLQKLGMAFEQSGVGLDTITANVTKLAKAIIGGDKAAVGALEQLGLSMTDLKAMAPEQQFTTVADAIGKIPNPTERAYAAMTIFGKGGAELLQGLDGHLTETTAQFEAMGLVMDEKTIAAADQFGDQLGLLMKQMLALMAQVIGPLLPLLSLLADALMAVGSVVGKVAGVLVDGLVRGLLSVSSAIATFLAGIADMAQRIPLLGQYLGVAGDAAEWLRGRAATLDSTLAGLSRTTSTVGTSAAAAVPALVGFGDKAEATGAKTRSSTRDMERFAAQLERVAELERGSTQVRAGFVPELKTTTTQKFFIEPDIPPLAAQAFTQKLLNFLPTVTQSAGPAVSQSFGKLFGTGLSAGLSSLGPTVLSALTGGGNVLKSVGSSLGQSLTKSIFGGEAIQKSISSIFGQTLGGAFNALLPGIGALAGPLMAGIGKLFGKLFGGPSQQEVQGRSIVKQFEDELASALTETQKLEAGNDEWKKSVIRVRDAYLAAGRTEAEALAIMDRLWKAEKQGPEAVKAVIDEINRTMAQGTTAAVAATAGATLNAVTAIAAGATDAIGGLVATSDIAQAALRGGGGQRGGAIDGPQYGVDAQGRLTINGALANTSEGGNRLVQDALNAGVSIDAINQYMIDNNGDERRLRSAYGFATGTGGQYLDFGSGTPVTLHGRERVMTAAEGRAEAASWRAMADELSEIRAALKLLPKHLTAAMQAAV